MTSASKGLTTVLLSAAVVVVSCKKETAGAGGVDASTTSTFPPTGEYQVTARVLSDTCQPAYVAPVAPWNIMVHAVAEKTTAKANLILAAVPPMGLNPTTDGLVRSDVQFSPFRKPAKMKTWPLPGKCGSYQNEVTLTVTDSNATGFVVVLEVDHDTASRLRPPLDDNKKCAEPVPSNCITKVEHTYKLIQSMCAAECTRGVSYPPVLEGGKMMLGDMRQAKVDCRCP